MSGWAAARSHFSLAQGLWQPACGASPQAPLHNILAGVFCEPKTLRTGFMAWAGHLAQAARSLALLAASGVAVADSGYDAIVVGALSGDL